MKTLFLILSAIFTLGVSSANACHIVVDTTIGTNMTGALENAGHTVAKSGLGDVGVGRVITGERVLGIDPFGFEVLERTRKLVIYKNGKVVAETAEYLVSATDPLINDLLRTLKQMGCNT